MKLFDWYKGIVVLLVLVGWGFLASKLLNLGTVLLGYIILLIFFVGLEIEDHER